MGNLDAYSGIVDPRLKARRLKAELAMREEREALKREE